MARAKQRNTLNESCGVDLINNPTPKRPAICISASSTQKNITADKRFFRMNYRRQNATLLAEKKRGILAALFRK
jgi:hypothetical protein